MWTISTIGILFTYWISRRKKNTLGCSVLQVGRWSHFKNTFTIGECLYCQIGFHWENDMLITSNNSKKNWYLYEIAEAAWEEHCTSCGLTWTTVLFDLAHYAHKLLQHKAFHIWAFWISPFAFLVLLVFGTDQYITVYSNTAPFNGDCMGVDGMRINFTPQIVT